VNPRLAAASATPKEDQQAPICSGMFHRDPHELLDQLRKDHLT